MSDDFHRPTYTATSCDAHGEFNPTQVRLYGIPGLSSSDNRKGVNDVLTGVHENLFIIASALDKNGIDAETRERLRSFVNFESNKSSYVFVNTKIKDYMIMLGAIDVERKDKNKIVEDKCSTMSSGIIFGYAYEGHTYDLPKPKIMLIPAQPEKTIPDDDSGYDDKATAGYTVWIVDKLDQCIEIEVNQGFIEQLVLEANLPGQRSPTMYAGKMKLGHRSGRLTE